MRTRARSCWTLTAVGALALAGLATAPVDAAPARAVDPTPVVPAFERPGSVPGLSNRLADLVAAQDAGLGARATARSIGVAVSGAGSLQQTADGSQLVVEVRLAPGATIAGAESVGASELARTPGSTTVTMAVAPEELVALSEADGVEYVGEQIAPETSGVCDTTVSEGDGILKAAPLRAAHGLSGAGVKVGVLSDSFDKLATPTSAATDVASDNLPGAANTCGHTSVTTVGTEPASGSDEGRAMAQAVHDLAPGSPIDFESAFVSEAAFATSIDKLVAQGARTIVDDVTYFDEPFYQDGVVEQAITRARAAGVDYFTSSGNNSIQLGGNQVGSYEATAGYRATPCPAFVASFDPGYLDCHNFNTSGAADSSFSFVGSGTRRIRLDLQWAEPFGGVTTDLDVFLYDTTTGTLVSRSTTTNPGGSQTPLEFLSYTPSAAGHSYDLVVARYGSAAPALPRFKIVFLGNGLQPFASLEHPTATGTDVMGPTAFGHNGGRDAVSVGASSVVVTPSALESYSSFGPVTTLFGPVRADGTPAAALSAPVVVDKPDLVASDCGQNSFFGSSSTPYRFCGTSQAAPHAAAVAALLQEQTPTATAAQVNAAMVASATPIAGATAAQQGGGLVNALAAATLLSAPSVTGVDPASPNASTTPKVKGTTTPGTATVAVYTSASCTGAPVATGTAAAFSSAGLPVTVGAGTSTTYRATATDTLGNVSPCSTSSASYTAYPVPDTALSGAPKAKVTTKKKKTKVSFSFTSTVAGASFACSLDGAAYTPCASGSKVSVKVGTHTFAVRSSANGVTDATPATTTFKVARKKKHHPRRRPR